MSETPPPCHAREFRISANTSREVVSPGCGSRLVGGVPANECLCAGGRCEETPALLPMLRPDRQQRPASPPSFNALDLTDGNY